MYSTRKLYLIVLVSYNNMNRCLSDPFKNKGC